MKLSYGEVLYYLLKKPVKLYLKLKFNIHVENNELGDIKEPYLLLGHHVTAFDPIISNAYSNGLIRYVAGDANQDNRFKKILLGLLESIPFSKNRADAKSIHHILRHVKKGHPIGLYPEGGRNWDGSTDIIIPSTAKLIKLMKIPVYAVFYKGGYLSKPRWASHFRKGKVILDIRKIFDKDIIEQKSSEELYNLLVDKLNYNEYEWQKENKVIFKGDNLAEDVERLLYICPSCLSVNSIESKGNKFHCSICRKEYEFNQYGEIEGCTEFAETVSWNKWQKTLLPNIIKEGYSFWNFQIPLEKVDLKNGTRNKLRVLLFFSQEKLIIHYEKEKTETICIKDLSGLSITFMDVVEFFVDKIKYRFIFNPKQHMSVKLFYDLIMTIKNPSLPNQEGEEYSQKRIGIVQNQKEISFRNIETQNLS